MAQDTKWNVHDNIWQFSVTDPHLHSKGFTIYRVTCKTFPIRSPEALTEIICWKRYNDFKMLHKSLLALHRALHRRDQFPEFAKPKLFGRFDDNVIEERRMNALEILNFVATQPHLYKSLVFKQFLEEGRSHSDSGLGETLMTPRPSNLVIPSGGPGGNAHSSSDIDAGFHTDIKDKSANSITASGNIEQNRSEHTAGCMPANGSSQKSRAELALLEGTWNFPQVADNISLSSSTGDDATDMDDESILASSLPDADLAFFDPMGHDGLGGNNADESGGNIAASNSWLLEGMNICAGMQSNQLDNQAHDETDGEAVITPVEAESSTDCSEAILSTSFKSTATNTRTMSSSTPDKFSSDPSSPVSSSRKGSSGSGNATPFKSFDLEEFDPIRRMSQGSDSSKVECGKGDVDLSGEIQGSSGFVSDVSSSHGSQDKRHPENVFMPLPETQVRSQSVGSDKSQDSDQATSNKSTPLRSSRSLLKRLVSGSPVSHKSPPPVTEQNPPAVDLSSKEDYIYLAASQISMAQNSEVNGDFEVAFAYYKSGVGILLQGVQGDTNQSRRDAVRRKTAQYLMKAEDLFNRHLADENVDERRWGADSFLSPSLDLDPSFAFIRGSVRELRNFQVLGTVGKVLLVRDKVTDETFVVKSIPKSTPDVLRTPSILPTSCPHMVSLQKFYENDDSVFLLLQYASGGKLWTYIGDYLNTDRGSQANGDINLSTVRTNVRNIYSGTKLETSTNDDKLDHVPESSGSKLGGVLNEDLDSGSSDNKLKPDNSLHVNTQPEQVSGVMRFSALKENSELYEGGLSEESSRKESSNPQTEDLVDGSESHDVFNDSDLNNVLKHTHKKHSLDRRYSNLSDDYSLANEGDNNIISPFTAPEEDQFQSLLHGNRGNLEAFSINSFDSEDTHRTSSSFLDKIRSTSESSESTSSSKYVTPRQISADEVFTQSRKESLSVHSDDKVRHASTDGVFTQNTAAMFVSAFNSDDLISNSKELLKHVEKVLAETNDRGEESDRPSSNQISPVHAVASSSSSNNCTEEPSIYDVNHSSKEGETSIENINPLSEEGETSTENINNLSEEAGTSTENANHSSVEGETSAENANHSSVEGETSAENGDKNSHCDLPSDKLDLTSADLSTSDSLNDVAAITNKDDVGSSDSSSSAVIEKTEHALSTESPHKTPPLQPASTSNSLFRQAGTPKKLQLNRMSSKDMTRSASFECDLKSPTRNRARAVSDMFERLDSVSMEQVRIPESSIKKWMSQLVTAVSRLHSLGIICRDLKPSNILLGDGGHVYLSYFCSLGHGDPELDWEAVENLYAAPEVGSVSGYDKSCDWWSIGALFYELIVGRSLIDCHPGGINSHTCLYVPAFVSSEAKGLLEGLLHHNPHERLGSKMAGSEEIKAHPFFSGVDWHGLEYS